ncbi:MAG: pyridoxamine 5'-phosphate oxidase family protein [Minisyncoccia bacterium]
MLTEVKIREDAYNFLRENSTAVVATSFNGDPRASTVYYFVDEDFNFYFVTKRKTSKYLNAELNPKVALVVGFGPEHISVSAHGRVELIVNDIEKQKIISIIVGKQNLMGVRLWPIDELRNLEGSHKVVLKVVPDEMFFMNLDSDLYPETIGDTHMKII